MMMYKEDSKLYKSLYSFNQELYITHITGLAAMIQDAKDLQVLDLSDCCIDDRAIETLASSIRANSSIISINLRNNNITHAGGIELSKAIKRHPTIREVSLGGNPVDNISLVMSDIKDNLAANSRVYGKHTKDVVESQKGCCILC